MIVVLKEAKPILSFILLFFSLTMMSQENLRDSSSVYFENKKFEITEERLPETLKNILRDIKTRQIDSVVIKGYANYIGDTDTNYILSFKRAQEVARALKKVNDSVPFAVNAYGEIDGSIELNRRVDVFLYYQKIIGKQLENNVPREIEVTVQKVIEKKVLEGIRFVRNRDIILKKSEPALFELLTYAIENENCDFVLYGHICCSPEPPEVDAINLRTGSNTLSKDRAKAVYDYLVQNGVNSARLQYVGKAFTEPLGGEEPTLDMRVEVEVIRN